MARKAWWEEERVENGDYMAPIFEKLERSRCLQSRWRKLIQSFGRKARGAVPWMELKSRENVKKGGFKNVKNRAVTHDGNCKALTGFGSKRLF